MDAGPDITSRFDLGSALRRASGRSGPALLAALGAVVLAVAGWHGKDYAASTYRVNEFRHHGVVLWDTAWYGGNYPLSYSVLLPPIGALLGLAATGVVAAAACAALFDRLVSEAWGRRPFGSWFFAISTFLEVGIGQFPFLIGEVFALGALVAMTRRRAGLAVAAGVAAALCSGVAAAFLAVAAVGWAWAAGSPRRPLIALAVIPVGVLGAFNVAFPGTGSFPYPVGGLLLSLAACALALTPPFRSAPAVRAGALLYAALAIGAFLIPSPMGGNASRFAQGVGIPLLVCFVFTPFPPSYRLPTGAPGHRSAWPWSNATGAWRGLAALVLIPLVVWQWGPGTNVVKSLSRAPATTSAFYQPLINAVAARAPAPVRLEVVPTEQHWESTYVAPHFVLARGWERQLDISDNPLFYRSEALTPGVYRQWLLRNGVSFVALADAPLDYAAQREGRLVSSEAGAQAAGLALVWRSANWELWRVDTTPGLLTGPGQLTRLGPDAATVAASGAATFTLRVRWTRYWSLTSGDGCIEAGPAGWTTLHIKRPGVVSIRTTFDPRGGMGHC